MLSTWWQRSRQRRSRAAQRAPRRLHLEALETRLVPAAVTRAGTGADTAALAAIVDQFRTDLGGAVNGVGGSFLTGRREINWDGVPDGSASPNPLAGNFFNTTSARGVVFTTPGSSLQVSARVSSGVPVRFGNINATYTGIFTTFSPERLFTAIGSTTTEVTFFVPNQNTISASVSGFGAVFTDVDTAGSTMLEFFDQASVSLGSFPVPALNSGLSFLGVSFNAGERVARVRITSGNAAPAAGVDDGGANDVVVMDDFIYGEPQPVRFQFSAATYVANENGGTAFVTVTRTGGTFGAATVNLNTVSASAQAGLDFGAVSQTLSFATGEASKTVGVPIFDDLLAEGIETLNLTLSGNSAGTILGTPSLATLTIVDNETPPVSLLGLTNNNKLVRFDAANPGTILNTVTVTGLQAGETLRGIDYRPATGELYGLGSTSRIYTINTVSGAATQIGPGAFTPALSGATFGIDFNPTVDRIRVVSDADQNLRLNPINGAVAGTDTNLAYAAGDPNVGANPNVVASGYTNNFVGSTATTLYGIDSNLDILVRQGGIGGPPSPNGGQLFTLAPLGFDVQDLMGFDIVALGNQAFAAMTLVGESAARLFTINLNPATTGTPVAAAIGAIGGPDAIIGLAVVLPGAFQFSAAAYTGAELCAACAPAVGNPIVITVTRTGGTDGAATVNFAVTAGTATAGTDFQTTSGLLSFNSGETSKTFVVNILDDTMAEGLETILLSLSNPTGGAILGTRSTATLTILDNETPLPFFYALTDMNNLLRVDAANPSNVLSSITITGLQASENVLGIDYRPANTLHYALGSTSRLYTLNPTTGAATQVGTGTFAVLLDGTAFGFDFNPAADRLRVVSNTGQNLRLHPDTGAVVDGDPGMAGTQPDTPLAYALNDVNFGATPSVVGSAYTNNLAGVMTTTLFGIDATRSQLVRQGGVDGPPSPNGGQLFTISNLGFATQTLVGFDIAANGLALAVLIGPTDSGSSLYVINLSTGAAIFLGNVGQSLTAPPFTLTPSTLRGLAIIPAGVIQLSAATTAVAEDAGVATLTLTRVGGSDATVIVSFATSDGTARAGIDYVATTGTVTFGSGETTKMVTVPLRDNGRIDGNRTFTFTITNASGGAVLGVPLSATVTITDNDAGLTQVQRFVSQLYFDVLNRPADAGGLATWTNLLNSGGTRDQVVRAFVNSAEYKTVVVRGLYQKYLRRDADTGGLNAFVGFLVGGGTVEQAIAALVGSPEYFNGPGGGTNATFLATLYQDVLGRPIDPAGQSLFGGALTAGTSRQVVASIILGSDEYFRFLVGGFYTRFLGRTADPAGLAGFTAFLKNGARQEDVIVLIVASGEYFGRV